MMKARGLQIVRVGKKTPSYKKLNNYTLRVQIVGNMLRSQSDGVV